MENLFVKEDVYQEIKRKMNKKDDCFTKKEMAEYTRLLKENLGECRNINKIVFKITGRIYRGVTNGRFTSEEALTSLNKKVGAVNERFTNI